MAFDNLRIIRLQAENIKRLVAVEISPKGDLVTIAGKNGQGKTSVLDSILWAMAGGRAIQWKPIRDGEQAASIRLELGNDDGLQLIVTRTFAQKDGEEWTTKLDVRSADGMKPAGAQTFLEAMVGALSFDPAAFIRADAKKQIEILKTMIRASNPKADFDGIASRRQQAFDRRTEVKREQARLEGSAAGAGIGEENAALEVLRDTEGFLESLSSIGELSAERARIEAMRDRTIGQLEEEREDAEALRKRISSLKDDLSATEKRIASLDAEVSGFLELEPLPDATEIRAKLSEANLENDAIGQRNLARASFQAAKAKAAEVEALSQTIVDCDVEARDLIERAKLPVTGLSIGPDYVMLRGVPFAQASDAEQLRASMALGMAANPKLRVLRIRDGSLLDDDALAVIREVAGEEDFQVWLEKVGDGGPEAFILENGMVRS